MTSTIFAIIAGSDSVFTHRILHPAAAVSSRLAPPLPPTLPARVLNQYSLQGVCNKYVCGQLKCSQCPGSAGANAGGATGAGEGGEGAGGGGASAYYPHDQDPSTGEPFGPWGGGKTSSSDSHGSMGRGAGGGGMPAKEGLGGRGGWANVEMGMGGK